MSSTMVEAKSFLVWRILFARVASVNQYSPIILSDPISDDLSLFIK